MNEPTDRAGESVRAPAGLPDGLQSPWWQGTVGPLAAILILGAALRIHRLEDNPPGLYCDEVAIAANARSIGLTGRNLGGDFLPLYCEERSYAFWGVTGILYQPVYLYASVPFATLLGCSPLVARLPSVLFGLLGIAGAFALGRLFFERRVGLAAAFLLALSPWHLQFSRIAFEAISLPALLTFGIYCLWRSPEKPRLLAAGAALLGLSTYAYPVAKLLVPLLLAVFVTTRFRQCLAAGLWGGVALGVLLVVVAPNLWLVLSGQQQDRTRELLIFSTHQLDHEAAVAYLRERASEPGWARGVLENRTALLPFVFVYNYISYVTPGFLYFDGDPNLRHSPGGMGMCLMVTAPLLLIGICVLVRRRHLDPCRFLLGWLLVWPIPASLCVEAPHAIRSIGALPILDLVTALGLVSALDAAKNGAMEAGYRSWRSRLAGGLLVAVLLLGSTEMFAYLKRYFVAYPTASVAWWQAGISEALQAAVERRTPGHRIWISRAVPYSYLHVLALPGVDPRKLDHSRDLNGQLEPFGFQIGIPSATVGSDPRDLWIVTAGDKPEGPDWRVLAELPYPDGTANLFLLRRAR